MTDQPNPSSAEQPTEDSSPKKPREQVESMRGSCDETFDSVPVDELHATIDSDLSSDESSKHPQLASQNDFQTRYDLQGEIARGGMGAVLRGRDRVLQRELAIKVLLDNKRGDASAFQRFVDEAQIGGQLQHPGIVPVYDMGQMEDESPFFAMKLVEGETLSSLLDQRASPAEDLPRFLGIFEQICQTVAFAHSRNVIHRDLKPSNVMVGAFGEVQVMDWGLAKVLTQTPENSTSQKHQAPAIGEQPESDGTIQSFRTQLADEDDTSGSQTRYGSVMGTLGYMPPEQAAGQIERVDTRADVFSLGAILCQILTGQQPYIGKSRVEILHMSIRGDLEPCYERLKACSADTALRRLAIDCLNPDVGKRLQNASEVADQVTAYLESVSERLRSAEIERAASTARAEEATKTAAAERKKRQLIGVLAGLGIALCTVVGLGGFIIQKNRAAFAEAEQKRQQERDEQMLRDKQLLGNELIVAETLVERIGAADSPASGDLEQLETAVQQAQETLTPVLKETELGQRTRDVASGFAQLQRAHRLVQALDAIQAKQSEAALRQDSRFITNRDGNSFEIPAGLNAAYGIATAFRDWIGTQEDSPEAVAGRLKRLPGWALPTVINSLYHWRHTKQDKRDYQRTRASAIHYLTLQNATSARGSKLRQLPDQSILVEGINSLNESHELIFDLGDEPFSAIQFQARSHPSLPANGPGRDASGKGVVIGLEFKIADADAPDDFQWIDIPNSEANYSIPSARFNGGYWNLAGGTGKNHQATFYLAKRFDAPKGARLRVSFHGSKDARWGKENIGCFRLAVLDVPTVEAYEQESAWVRDVLAQLDDNDWRQQLWQAIDKADTQAMVQLARDPAVKDQFAIDVIRLAESLFLLGESHALDQLDQQLTWTPFASPKLAGNKLESQPDGSLLAMEKNVANAEHSISTTFDQRSITAIRLETFLDDRLPDRGPGLHRRGAGCAIREMKVTASERAGSAVRALRFQSAISNHKRFLDRNTSFLTDGDDVSYWRLNHPNRAEVCSLVLVVDPDDAKQTCRQLVAKVWTGLGDEARVGRFRLSWTSDPVPAIVDGRAIAEQLLSSLHLRDPRDYRTLIARAQMAANKVPADAVQAQRFATAAMSLRPADSQTVRTYSQLLLAEEPEGDSPVLKHLHELAKVRIDQYDDPTVLDAILSQQRRLGDLYTYSKQRPRAIIAFENLLRFDPDKFNRHHFLGLVYGSEGQLAKAIEFLEEARRRTPEDDWIAKDLADQYIVAGRYNDAITLLADVPESVVPPLTKAIALAGAEKYDESILAWNRAVPTEAEQKRTEWEQRIYIAYAYAETGQVEKARALLDQILENSRGNTLVHLAHSSITEALNGPEAVKEHLTEAVQEYRFILDALSIEVMRQSLNETRFPTRFLSTEQLLAVTNVIRSMDERREQHLDAQAILLVQLDKPNDALKAINETMSRDRRSAMEWLIAAMAHQAMGDEDEFKEALEKADELRPDLQSSLHKVFEAHRKRIP